MAQYYKIRLPTAALNLRTEKAAEVATELSEFDKHRETLLSDDTEEGWASELRRYLGTMQRDVKKDTDLVEWWQVRSVFFKSIILCAYRYYLGPRAVISDPCAYCA